MKDWIYHTNVYEVNLRQYTAEGTINAFSNHLPRLKDMGVHTLWFMPLTPISEKNKKGSLGSYYACSDYTSVSPEFGTMSDWKQLVQYAHEMGFKVIIDWVANHTGWDHNWTRQHPEWYRKDEVTGDFKKASGMDDIIELDFTQAVVRKAMIDAMKFWVNETGIDGFRCDLAFWVNVDFWIEAKKELDLVKPLFWLGELDVLDSPEYMQVFDACYTWRWMHKAEHFYKGQISFDELIKTLQQYHSTHGLKTWFTTNHDENSWNGTEYEKYGDMALLLAVFSCTWPGIPLVYSGQELPVTKRLEFFEKDVIKWKEENALHSFYKRLLHLRRHKVFHANAPVEIIETPHEKILAFKRKSGAQEAVIVLNFSETKQQLDLNVDGEFTDLFSGAKTKPGAATAIELSPWQWLVLLQ